MPTLRALALDVDGTLLNPEHNVSLAVILALRDVRSRGKQVVLASARHVGSLVRIMEELGIDGIVVAFSGGAAARVHRDGTVEILFESKLPLELATAVAREALNRGLNVGWYSAEQWYAPSADGWYEREARILQQSPIVVPDLGKLDWAPNKLQVVAYDGNGIAMLHALRETLPGDCTAVFSHADMLEVLPLGTNKAAGLAKASKQLGVQLEEILAFGDAENDIEMLQEAGIGIAMGQASSSVKAAADWVTTTNAEDGVAFALGQEWLQRRLHGDNMKATEA